MGTDHRPDKRPHRLDTVDDLCTAIFMGAVQDQGPRQDQDVQWSILQPLNIACNATLHGQTCWCNNHIHFDATEQVTSLPQGQQYQCLATTEGIQHE